MKVSQFSKLFAKTLKDSLVDLFANMFLWLLMWTGAVIALIDSGEIFLAILLILSGIAKAYVEHKKSKKGKNEK